MTQFCIDVKGLNKHFASRHAVKDFSLKIQKGEIYGFLGPNGSGKTTSIRMMCGLITPDAGSGQCLGMDIFTQREAIKKRIGYMTQHFSMWGNLSIRENLLFFARLHGLQHRQKQVEQTLDGLGLLSRQHQLARELSGGWKQRMALAACLLHQPEVVFLDEPTAGVDPKARREFWQTLHQLSDKGISILVSTHYMDEAERCHKVAYLSSGRLLANGTIESIIQAQQLTTVRVCGKGLSALESKLQHFPAIEQTVIFGNALYVTVRDEKELQRIFSQVVSDQYACSNVATNLEDAFTWLMRQHDD
ncbi:ABC transporter ATP-binding protein [Erwinia tracheiphila]|uniref:ABC transporter ATP-binding protein n=1 Tax=Erwinia tracheiphila TaxID=65700 RepID=A0A0M2KBX4_9GAMM|nr:ABC transporter ATP-binding protein [Erwinia tracheiphila]AXF78162.1 ABC transporter ATP-binding protein [Erwinia tracheiphila]EOS94602.1 putative ABC-type multidrug transport system, ATPase component [Erwinia tracheiphila PSU-1]KKF36885.1 multidrug ABC transporter ATP-binding protein [Erwinia tracheiphila]UIA83118.1 ABC transporter ATP-binding protein [Erwinia tracheiphila]UIA88225.1 ABC transporter ATP-binding protein [Erwinia tracheiphila]